MENYKVNENGYIRVYIYKKTFPLHRLVALTFLENSENKKTVNHKDGDKLNNCVDNLEFATNREQQIHKYQNGLANLHTRKIKQYDLNWNLIKTHSSIALAAKEVNISKGAIQSVLLEKGKTAAGFIWKYSDDENIDFSEKITINKNIGRNVGQYDLNMNLIKIHNSIAEASREVNIHKNNIWGVTNNLRKTSGGFIWKYLD
jgi:molybdenum-dependent DNA-binding transcriptional regulator ModE